MKNEPCRLKVTGAYCYSRNAGVTPVRGSVKRRLRKAAATNAFFGLTTVLFRSEGQGQVVS